MLMSSLPTTIFSVMLSMILRFSGGVKAGQRL